jgi:hypothetical protein
MLRNVSVCIIALVAVLLFSSDASAGRRSRGCCGSGYGYYGTSYGCCGGCGYGYYGTTSGCCGGSGYSNGSGVTTGATTGTDTSGTDTSGRARNPGGIGGPASGIGVRPGVGAGGAGRGR